MKYTLQRDRIIERCEGPGVPGRGTPPRTVRVTEELWLAALAKAEARGEVLSEEIRRFLERYVKKPDKKRR